MVEPKPGETILDACAAPGAKTTQLGQLMGNRGRIYALDISGTRMRLLRESCRRMGVTNVTALRRDASLPISLSEAKEFDAILIDVPCTGWGTIRRNPDIKWRTGYKDIARMASIQRKILDNLAGLLRIGGEDGLQHVHRLPGREPGRCRRVFGGSRGLFSRHEETPSPC